MKLFLTSKYKGRSFRVVNNYVTGLSEGAIVRVLDCEGYGSDGDPFFNVHNPKVQGVMLSWLEDKTIMKEIRK